MCAVAGFLVKHWAIYSIYNAAAALGWLVIVGTAPVYGRVARGLSRRRRITGVAAVSAAVSAAAGRVRKEVPPVASCWAGSVRCRVAACLSMELGRVVSQPANSAGWM